MAIRFQFYDSIDGDRTYNSDALAQWAKGIVTEGYVPDVGDELVVSQSTPPAMSVVVGLGIAWVDGRYFEVYSSGETLVIGNADGSNPRIDRVVVRNDLSNRETVLAVKTGTPGSNPAPPALQRDATIYEISLAQIFVPTAANSISDSNITDERDDEVLCGVSMPYGTPPELIGHLTNTNNPHNVTHQQVGAMADDADTGGVLGGQVTGQDGTAVGVGASAGLIGSAVGNASVADSSAVAVGNSSVAGLSAVAIGSYTEASAFASVAIGAIVEATSNNEGVLGGAEGGDTNSWRVPGDFTVNGTKNFEVPHPDDPDLAVRHASYEGPVPGGTLYRYRVEVANGDPAVQELPDYFNGLNTDVDVHVSPVEHFGRAYGVIDGNTLTVHADSDGEYAVLILGTRNDPQAQEAWELYQDVRPAGISWNGHTRTVDEDIEVDGEIGVAGAKRRYRAPEGQITERIDEHMVGYVVELEDDDDESGEGVFERVEIDRDAVAKDASGVDIVSQAKQLVRVPRTERPAMRRHGVAARGTIER